MTPPHDETAVVLPIDSILVANRYRKEFRSVDALATSIVNIGLLNPITVTEYHGGYRLVAGERRLRAFQQLGLAEIPARVARDVVDARDLLVAERDENTEREPMLPSEATALGMAIEQMEKPAALARQSPGRPMKNAGPGTRDKGEIRPRDIAAEAIGMGEASYRRMKTLVTTAADSTEPEETRKAAREAVENIDNGAPIRREYDRVKAARTPKSTEPPRNVKHYKGRSVIPALQNVMHTLSGLAIPLRAVSADDLAQLDEGTAAEWTRTLNDALGALRHVKHALTERNNK